MAGRLVRSWRSFRRRRLDIAVGPDALVLDVGSGDKPHWRADVLVDRYAGADHGGQRSGRAAARVSRPLFDADAAALPFADGVFDYVVCSHVLEHVPDPAAVVAEITRVGRAGYLELPEAASAKILDFPSHLWWCRLDGDTLVLTAKSARHHDPEIGRYIADSGIEHRLARLLDSEFDHRILSLHWRGGVDLKVEGTPDPDFIAAALAAAGHHQRGQTVVGRMLLAVLTLPRRHGPGRTVRRAPIRFDDIVTADRRRGTGEVLTRQVYRVSRR